MQRRFLKFIIWTISVGTVLIFMLSGCSIYEKIDSRLHPTPVIENKVDYQLNRYSNGRLDVNFTVFVTDADLAMFYYSCKTDDGWDDEKEVGSQRIEDGKAESMHITMCSTALMVNVIAYNNFMKRSQKFNGKTWLIDLGDLELL